jgi:hypothetical protein
MKTNHYNIEISSHFPLHVISAGLTLFFLLASLCFGTIIGVPGDHSTIQAAINAAADGDQIVVSPGTYVENINFGGKNIILRSTDPTDPSVVAITIIDGNDAGSVVTFSGTEGTTCVLSGLTIRNGHFTDGGGIEGNATLATIQYNTIAYNSVQAEYANGGGIHRCNGTIHHNNIYGNSTVSMAPTGGGGLSGCSGTIENNVIWLNSSNRNGAGLFACSGIIQNNTIEVNSAADYGGAMYGCNGTIRNNLIVNNTATFGGAFHSCAGTIEHNTSRGNSAPSAGGGFYECDATIQNNVITANSSTHGGALSGCDGIVQNNFVYANRVEDYSFSEGGGLYNCNGTIQSNTIYANLNTGEWGLGGGLSNCWGIIRNNIIAENSATGTRGKGGGLFDCGLEIENNTVCGNYATYWGGGIYHCDHGYVKNCILWNNSATTGSQIYDSLVPTYSCIQEWSGGGTGNISLEPLFVNPSIGDLHLQDSSPCIDAGDPAPEFNDACRPPGKGTARNDMGAYGGPYNCSEPPAIPTATPPPTAIETSKWLLY